MMKRRYHKRRPSLLLLTLILFVLIAFFAHQLSAPVHGHVTKTNANVPQIKFKKTATLPPGTIQNSYFVLTLPTGYRLQESGPAPPGLLYQQTVIKAASFGSVIIAISLKSLPEGGMGEDSAYRLRSQQPTRYHFDSQSIGGEQVSIVNDTASSTVVAFWPHNSYLATISASSGIIEPEADQNANLQAILKVLINGWQWQH